MAKDLNLYKKATTLDEVDRAVRLTVPIPSDHEFFTDFSDVRGDFEDRMIYKSFNVNPKTFIFNEEANRGNKTILFLAGMRGSGKTTELAKISKKMHHRDAFLCVTCNLDEGLDLNDLEYMDILIFQIERLFEDLQYVGAYFDKELISSLYDWFSERIKEVNTSIKKEGGLEIELKAETPSFWSFFKLTGKLRGSLSGVKENADKIRRVFKNNFTKFAQKFNELVETANKVVRENNAAKEILFIVDGLEKVSTLDLRKKIILEESNRLKQIQVNIIFTLPIELMPHRQLLSSFSTVVSFPFVKIKEKNGVIVEKAIQRFEEFVYKRIDKTLFDSPDTVRKAIIFGGGSPRELLRILEYAYLCADEDLGKIDAKALDKAIEKLANETSRYVTMDDLEKLKELRGANHINKPIPFDESWQKLLENLIIFEYNDGTYKRVNPIVEESKLYKQYVIG